MILRHANERTIPYRGVEQLVARRAHNPEVVWFKSHPRNQKSSFVRMGILLFRYSLRFYNRGFLEVIY